MSCVEFQGIPHEYLMFFEIFIYNSGGHKEFLHFFITKIISCNTSKDKIEKI